MIAPLTTTGARRLRDELEHLKSVKRPAVIHAIAEARPDRALRREAPGDRSGRRTNGYLCPLSACRPVAGRFSGVICGLLRGSRRLPGRAAAGDVPAGRKNA